MRWFFNGSRPRLWRFVALLLICFVAYFVEPIVFYAGYTPFQRLFAVMAFMFFTYLILRSVSFWESLSSDMFRRR
jgi:hypothetical protein